MSRKVLMTIVNNYTENVAILAEVTSKFRNYQATSWTETEGATNNVAIELHTAAKAFVTVDTQSAAHGRS